MIDDDLSETPESSPVLAPGVVWTFPADEPTTIFRPDGKSVRVRPRNGLVRHVLDVPGDYVSGDHTVTAD